MADALTINEELGSIEGKKVTSNRRLTRASAHCCAALEWWCGVLVHVLTFSFTELGCTKGKQAGLRSRRAAQGISNSAICGCGWVSAVMLPEAALRRRAANCHVANVLSDVHC